MTTMMSKTTSITLMLSLLLVLMLTACGGGGDSFKIDGTFTGIDADNLRIVYASDSGVVDEWVEVLKGKFDFKGLHASEPTIVAVLDGRNQVIAQAVAQAGDHIRLKGDATKAMGVTVSGTDVNDRWQEFRSEHAAFYSDPNPSRRDAAIEKYVRDNASDVLSTVLLMADYSDLTDRTRIDALLKGIAGEARPASLTRGYQQLASAAKGTGRITSLTLWRGGDFEQVQLMGRTSLLYLWSRAGDNDRAAIIDALKRAGERTSALHIADVLVESDTIRWGRVTSNPPTPWKHYWAPSGPLDGGLRALNIRSTPWLAVVREDGSVAYSGPDVQQACRIAAEAANASVASQP